MTTVQQIRDAIDAAYNERCRHILLPLMDHEWTAIVEVATEAVVALLSQPTPTAEPCTCDWHMSMRDPDSACSVHAAEPPRIEDLAAGTTFTYPTRWEVSGRGGLTGRDIAEMVEENTTRYLDGLDPSMIRDVRPPAVTS